MPKKYIEAGKVVGTHGVKGEVRVNPWCDSPEFLTKFKKFYLSADAKDALDATSVRAHGNICLISFSGTDSIEKAEKLRGKTVYIDRDDCKLEPGRYFIDDIIGSKVIDADNGTVYGKVSDVSETGANDVWYIKNDNGEYLIPNVPEFVKKVDIDAGEIFITPLKGTFDSED